MSGGHFDYVDSRAKDEIFGWRDNFSNVFEDREISELIWDVFNLIHDFDWYKSGDTMKATYLKAKAEFKKQREEGKVIPICISQRQNFCLQKSKQGKL